MGVAMVFCMGATMLANLYTAGTFDRLGSYERVWQSYSGADGGDLRSRPAVAAAPSIRSARAFEAAQADQTIGAIFFGFTLLAGEGYVSGVRILGQGEIGMLQSSRVGGALLCLAVLLGVSPAMGSFATFESGQVRPLALSPDGSRAVRGQHARQSTRDLRRQRRHADPRRLGAGRHGAGRRRRAHRHARSGWSTTSPTASASSTSAATPPRVVRTLLVGDEPRDIVFAGHRVTATPAPSSPPRGAARTCPATDRPS